MWFKRRKKTEQDHAVSESLRSLQSLLSETGRHEPNLDPSRAPDAPPPGEAIRAADRSYPSPTATSETTDREHEAPDNPGGTGNRWRDLNLSFDAEPVRPRTRRKDRSADEEDAPRDTRSMDTPGAVDEPVDKPDEPVDEPIDEPVDTPDVGKPDITAGEPAGAEALAGAPPPVPDDASAGEPEESVPDPEVEEPEPGSRYGDSGRLIDSGPAGEAEPGSVTAAGPAAEDDDETPPLDPPPWTDHEYRSGLDDEVLVLDLDVPPPAPPEGTETSRIEPSDSSPDEDNEDFRDAAMRVTTGDEEDAPVPEPGGDKRGAGVEDTHTPRSGAQAPLDTPAPDDTAEDQLHLELGTPDASETDIPVLTNAVYVPDEPAAEHAPPGPAASAHDADAGRCIDNFRVRLQLMGLNTLSADQENALHETLVEFLEDHHQG